MGCKLGLKIIIDAIVDMLFKTVNFKIFVELSDLFIFLTVNVAHKVQNIIKMDFFRFGGLNMMTHDPLHESELFK